MSNSKSAVEQMLARKAGPLMAIEGYRSLALSMRVDRSSSVFSRNLEGAMVQAVQLTERTLALQADNLVTRSTFCATLEDLDVEVKGNNQRVIRFRHPDDAVFPNFSRLYTRGWGTHLDVVILKDLQRLIRRWQDPSRRPNQRQIHLIMTDGVFVPGGDVGGPDHLDEIRPLMDQLLAIADGFGGPENSPIAYMYVGFGKDRSEHIRLATGRYGIPACWVLGREATVVDIVDAGHEISRSVINMNDGLKSCFGWGHDDQQEPPNHTQFGYGDDE